MGWKEQGSVSNISAWVLVVGFHGRLKRIAQELTQIQENPGAEHTGKIISIDIVTGPFDAIVKVRADDIDKLCSFIVDAIQTVEGVERTNTCLVTHLN